MKKIKIINILQGPSGVGKSRLIERLKEDKKMTMDDKIRMYDLQNYINNGLLPPFESQMLIMSSMKDNIINAIFGKESTSIYVDTNLEGTLIISSILHNKKLLNDSQYELLIQDVKDFYEYIAKEARRKNIELQFNYLNLEKPLPIIKNQIKNRGSNELNNPLIMDFNNKFYDITCEFNITSTIFDVTKHIKKYGVGINIINIKSKDEYKDWNDINLNELIYDVWKISR